MKRQTIMANTGETRKFTQRSHHAEGQNYLSRYSAPKTNQTQIFYVATEESQEKMFDCLSMVWIWCAGRLMNRF